MDDKEILYTGKEFSVWNGKGAVESDFAKSVEISRRPKRDSDETYIAYEITLKNKEVLKGFLNEPKESKGGLAFLGTPRKDEEITDYKVSVFNSTSKTGKPYTNINIEYKDEKHKAFLNMPKE